MFKWFVKGILVGAANIIPGVSGGTIAVVLSIYNPLINSLSHAFSNWSKLRPHLPFLVCVGSGAVIGIVLFSKLLTFAFGMYPSFTNAVLLGILMGGIPILFRSNKHMKPTFAKFGIFVFGFIAMACFLFFSSHLTEDLSVAGEPSQIILFVTCAIAAGAMIIPGISGSLLLVIFGAYEYVLQAIDQLLIGSLAIIALASLVGIGVFSKIMNKCISQFPAYTYYFLIGMIIASSYVLLPSLSDLPSTILFIPLGYWFTQKLG